MQLKRYICWDEGLIEKYVGDAVEERSSLDSVLERHVPVRLHKAETHGQLQEDAPECSEEEFLEEFLGKSGSSILTGVIGEAGHGKTHLVHWVHARLGQRAGDDYELLLIPRTETSLPGIFDRLLSIVPEAERGSFEEMRGRLDDFLGQELDPYDLRLKLFHDVTEALSQGVTGLVGLTPSEIKQYGKLVDGRRIAPFLQSPPLYEFLMMEGGVLHQVVSKSLTKGNAGQEEYEGEDRREFRDEDLPVEHWEEQLTAENQRLAKMVAHIFRSKRKLLATLLNRGVQDAVQSALSKSLSMDSAEAFLIDVRRAVGRVHPGRELILLIEDLARTKFIDEDLVKACTADAVAGQSGLATMRTLFATTSGLYTALQDSTQQRVTGGLFVLGHDWEQAKEPWLEFGSNYLDLFRKEGGCGSCKFREACFAVFGQHEGRGFYPLNPALLWQLGIGGSQRTALGFHPRSFLRGLADNSKKALLDIEAGEHPRGGFCDLEKMDVGGRSPEITTWVEGLGLATQRDRSIRAVRAYGQGTGRDRRIHSTVTEAFDLPSELAGGESPEAPKPRAPKPEVPKPEVPKPEVPKPADPHLPQIEAWQNGDKRLVSHAEVSMQRSGYRQMLGALHFWEMKQIPKLVRDRVLDSRSLVFSFSASDEGQGKPLAVTVELPMGQVAGMEGTFREPWRLAYLLNKSESSIAHLGCNSDGDEALRVEQYLKLGQAQDDLIDEVRDQLEGVVGSRAEEGAVGLQALMAQALESEARRDKLPTSLSRECLMEFLFEQKGGERASAAGEVMKYLGAWKESGEATILDLYRMDELVQVLEDLDRPLPVDIVQKQGRHLGAIIDQARNLLPKLKDKRSKTMELQRTLTQQALAAGLSDWSTATREELKAHLDDFRQVTVGQNLSRELANIALELEGLHSEALGQLTGRMEGDDYETLARAADPQLIEMAQRSVAILGGIEKVIIDLERKFVSRQGPSADLQGARDEFLDVYSSLIKSLKGQEVTP